ncbi:hypothetical protein [Streptomyces sp. MST-110588]|uniref:hypothetical protein n=1 Tax=Streptomyces sp. MST-110588 TaxID=2833628 RepID=UPI001F5D760B|nr:hypothetical protein [Streptomyces sp. MST-110588]UNO42938.1 hypothetical protein KGS77_29805 [Streptomyces sp. MST-110588]
MTTLVVVLLLVLIGLGFTAHIFWLLAGLIIFILVRYGGWLDRRWGSRGVRDNEAYREYCERRERNQRFDRRYRREGRDRRAK